MLIKSGVVLFLLAVIQVSARYKTVEPDFNENEINPQDVAVSSSTSRIVSGWVAQPGQLPYHATIRMVNPTASISRGAGAIVSRQWVITSAFCIRNRVSLTVRAGVLTFNNNNPQNFFETTEWHHHPSYNNLASTSQPHDIALVKLQRPVVYSELLRPIRVQSHADAYRDYDGQQVYASGYATVGSADVMNVLRGVYLRAISHSVCARSYWNTALLETGICAQFFNSTSQSVCNGNAGIPLVHVSFDGVPTLIGVFSLQLVGCPLGSPYVFVRPGPYLSWFNRVTGIDFDSLREDTTSTSTSTTTTTTTTTPTPTTTTTTTPTPTTTTTTTPIPTTTTTTTPIPTTTTTTTPTPTTTTTTTPIPTTTTTTTPTPTTTTTTTPTPTTTTTTTPTPTTTTTTTPTPTTTTTTTPTPTTTTTTTPIPTTSTTTTPTPTTTTTTTPTPTTTTTTTPTPTTTTTTTPTPTTTTTTTPTPTTTTTTAPILTTTAPTTSITTTPSISTTTFIPTTSSTTTMITESEKPEPEDFTPEEDTTVAPEDSEDKEEDDADSSECNEDDEMAQLQNRLEVNVKVKVGFNKYMSRNNNVRKMRSI